MDHLEQALVCYEKIMRIAPGSYHNCLPEDSVCPTVCHHAAPSPCMEGEVGCDLGTSPGCWMGNNCHPEGSECPPPVYI